MYFNVDLDSTRPEDASLASIHCRSRAVSSYNVFMDKYRSIGSVWLAVSEFTNYSYEGRVDVTGTGTQLDVDLGGLDTSALVCFFFSRGYCLAWRSPPDPGGDRQNLAPPGLWFSVVWDTMPIDILAVQRAVDQYGTSRQHNKNPPERNASNFQNLTFCKILAVSARFWR